MTPQLLHSAGLQNKHRVHDVKVCHQHKVYLGLFEPEPLQPLGAQVNEHGEMNLRTQLPTWPEKAGTLRAFLYNSL
jgi:hypothetical protein